MNLPGGQKKIALLLKKISDEKVRNTSVLLFFFSSLVYLNSGFNSFHFDDLATIVHNPYIRSLENIPSFFTNPKTFSGTGDAMYRPLLLVTYAVNYLVGGEEVFSYHLFNILLHSLNTVLLFLLLYQFILCAREESSAADETKPVSISGAFWGAMLFGVHTINTQAVNYISSRSVLLVAFFYMAALYAYIRSQGRPFLYLLSILFYLLSLLSKEVALTFPVTVFAYCILFEFEKKRSSLLRVIPFVVINLAGIFLAAGVYGLDGMDLTREAIFDRQGFARSLWSNFITQAVVLVYYLRLFLFPSGLALLHDFTVQVTLKEPVVILSMLFILTLLVSALSIVRKYRVVTFGVLWFFIAFIPETLFPLNMLVNEHRTYLPFAGLVMAVAALYTHVMAKCLMANRVRLLNLMMAAVIVCMGVSTVLRNQIWKNDITLWEDNILKNPKSYSAYDNLGSAYINRGETQKAISNIRKSLEINPLRSFPYLSLGIIYLKERDYSQAVKNLELSLRFEPESPDALNMLGQVFMARGEVAEALKKFTEAKRFRPFSDEFNYNQGLAYYALGEFDSAVSSFRKSVELNPDYIGAYNNLGLSLMARENYSMALVAFKKALKRRPGNVAALNNTAIVYLETDDLEKALLTLNRILIIDPLFRDGLNTFGEYHLKTGEYQKALEYFEKAISLKDGGALSWNAAVAAEKTGKVEAAVRHWRNFLKQSPDSQEKEWVEDRIRELKK